MNDKLCKIIYAALEIKHIPFTMYRTNDNTTMFIVKNDTIEITNEKVILNGIELESVYEAINKIKEI